MDLDRAVEAVLTTCLGVEAGERVVVVADDGTREIGVALRERAQRDGAEAVLAVMAPRANHGEEPPEAIANALLAADVFIAPTTKSLSHTRARKAATDRGARGATLPGVTQDLLQRLMTADFAVLRARSHQLARLLDEAQEAHFTCPRGSDLRLDIDGRRGMVDDGALTQPGAFGNLPCGEGFTAPRSGHGTLVASSIAGVGLVEETLTVENGDLVAGSILRMLRRAGERGTNLAELGIGTNEQATLTGNVLEDEKILGSVHIAFGASAGIGGNVSVPIHIDCVVLEPTLTIGGTAVIDAGRFLL